MALDIFTGIQADLSGVDFGATAEADFNSAVDLALNTVIPSSPVAGSINQVLTEIDSHLHDMGFKVIATGTFTTASVTVPADTGRTEANGYWDKCWIVPTQGAGLEINQPRQIASYAKTGGVFTMQTGTTWLTAPTGTYEIWSNGTGKNVVALGIFTTSSTSVPADNRRAEVTGYWNGCQIIPLTGAAANQPRNIALFTATSGVFSLPSGALFTTAPGSVAYAIVRGTQDQVPAVGSTSALTYKSTIGNKSDAAVTVVSAVNSIIAYVKGILSLGLPRVATKTSTSNLTSGTIFNIVGSVRIDAITARVSTAIQNSALTVKLAVTCDSLAAVDICGATTITNFAIKSVLCMTGTFVDVMAGGGAIAINVVASNPTPITICTTVSGVIATVFSASGTLTGAIVWEVLWTPLNATGLITAAA